MKKVLLTIIFIIFAVFLAVKYYGPHYGIFPLDKPVNITTSSDYYYGKDGGIVYSPSGNWLESGAIIIDSADRESFEPLSFVLAKDKDNVFLRNTLIKINGVDIDKETLREVYSEPVPGTNIPFYQRYAKDKNHVYCYQFVNERTTDNPSITNKTNSLVILEGADPKTFNIVLKATDELGLDVISARDNNNSYSRCKVVK